MRKNRLSIFILLILFVFPLVPVSAQTSNVGFVPGNIWYSKDPFALGDNIKIYTLIFNPDSREISGTVSFFNNSILLGKKNFAIPGKGVKDISIDWTVTVGSHIIFAEIENAKFLISKGKYEEVSLAQNKSEESKRSVSPKIDVTAATEGLVGGVKDMVVENTPPFVTEAIDTTVGVLEEARTAAGTFSDIEKDKVQKQIEGLNKKETKDEKFPLKPFKYVELFFLTIFSFIFAHKIIFYLLLAFVFYLILRFLWRLIF